MSRTSHFSLHLLPSPKSKMPSSLACLSQQLLASHSQHKSQTGPFNRHLSDLIPAHSRPFCSNLLGTSHCRVSAMTIPSTWNILPCGRIPHCKSLPKYHLLNNSTLTILLKIATHSPILGSPDPSYSAAPPPPGYIFPSNMLAYYLLCLLIFSDSPLPPLKYKYQEDRDLCIPRAQRDPGTHEVGNEYLNKLNKWRVKSAAGKIKI